MEEQKYGILLQKDLKLHRRYFKEMCKLIGVQVLYYQIKSDKQYTEHAEIKGGYLDPIPVACIFDEYPTQRTMKKLGWVAELQEQASVVHIPYDLPGIQHGCLFAIPSGLDDGKGRVFRVTKMTNTFIYPASIACEIVPEYENTFKPALENHTRSNLNLLAEEDDNL